jgi:hypothetical protein
LDGCSLDGCSLLPLQPAAPSETTAAISINTSIFFNLFIFTQSPFVFMAHNFRNLKSLSSNLNPLFQYMQHISQNQVFFVTDYFSLSDCLPVRKGQIF